MGFVRLGNEAEEEEFFLSHKSRTLFLLFSVSGFQPQFVGLA